MPRGGGPFHTDFTQPKGVWSSTAKGRALTHKVTWWHMLSKSYSPSLVNQV